jgi:ryanodine receptor 2
MGTNYNPTPIDTSGVELAEELQPLVERLAENAHDHWARQRISDGWTHGISRSDSKKQHPCLVPYSELPESERAYDRLVVVETIRTIVALGFAVQRRSVE